jgi:hypothetical protein
MVKMRYLLLSLVMFCSLLGAVSIYDIQYTENPGDGGYPSSYEGQEVTTGGIVTGTGFSGNRFFIENSTGGAWNGIYVYSNNNEVSLGDSVVINAQVYEYNGLTELNYVSSLQIISSGNELPQPVAISTIEANQEMYESVLVKIEDAVVSELPDEWGYWHLDDGSGSCTTDQGFFSMDDAGIPVMLDFPYSSLTGIMVYSWGEYHLNSRSTADLQFDPESYIITSEDLYLQSLEEFSLPLELIYYGDQISAQNYQLELEYNNETIQYSGYETVGTLSHGGSINETESTGSITINYSGDFSCSEPETLIKLNFTGLESGNGNPDIISFNIDGNYSDFAELGNISINADASAIGDTITVIQAPLLNIPQIVIPGDTLWVTCDAPESTSNWQITLVRKQEETQLEILDVIYNRNQFFRIAAQIPQQAVFEQYDLKVSADGIDTDFSENAVKILSEWKEDYYFIHITDTHLPTHLFYPDEDVHTDTTEVADFRAVIEDINVLNPEFVLLTGDLVNEGEMEEFENRRVYTIAQNMLAELDVPVYLVSGNHDIGGWDSSPPPQGTARRTWWKFFGWNWLEEPATPFDMRTQNYSFSYDQDLFIGMESYLNYDDFMYQFYGNESFTDLQMNWLEQTLDLHSDARNKIIFYHYDFSEQINLVNLDLDMALYGHIHSNDGNVNNPPYNLATDNVCDENRAFRLINVSDGALDPKYTSYSGYNGNELQVEFSPSNNAVADSVSATVQNSLNISVSNALLKFNMPLGAVEYLAYNGDLAQVVMEENRAVCYVNFDLPAGSEVNVSVAAIMQSGANNEEVPQPNYNLKIYPNPFNPETTISFASLDNQEVKVEIFNVKGQSINRLECHPETRNENQQQSVTWNGTDNQNKPVASGVYFAVLKSADKILATSKLMLMK